MPIIEVHRDAYTISTDPARIDIQLVYETLITTYWGANRTPEIVRRSVENSLNFGMYYAGQQVGNARIITDYATFAWLCDVFVLPEHRKHGLGKWLIETVTNHPDLKLLRRILLATRDAHGLYKQYGFVPLGNVERWMEKFNPNG